ncbi:YbdD/YjiX family protein [Diaphorobacter aerolatus]|uniref:YbdD/YjiX family protein n=1 Tax=Diaphorobacter aerolatus TaxID=1288495 RepID=A0A7H0GQ94_9BURK|nr:YbdD/YjiX family protein [Diaphorobacter aerolatus]QNP50460.1 YbdD/YjiX family protein [Diaphorobacter aerolatus]
MFDLEKLKQTGSYLGRAARMMVGMPDYGTYVRHMQENHPDKPFMSYEEFFRNRIDARYGGGSASPVRCC